MAGSYIGGSTLLHHLDPRWKQKKRKKTKKRKRITEAGEPAAQSTDLASRAPAHKPLTKTEKARRQLEAAQWERLNRVRGRFTG